LQDEKEELLSDNQILALRNIEMRKEIDTEHGKLVLQVKELRDQFSKSKIENLILA
jgi:hypothetical protein